MKTINTLLRKTSLFILINLPFTSIAQQAKIENLREYDKTGINVFETPKITSTKFDGLKVRIGAGFTQQFQSLQHENTPGSPFLYPRLAPGFGIASANLFTDVQLADGIRLNLTTYLAAHHHNESWVKGGYIQMDKVPFKGEFWDNIMKYTTFKMGHMEINYGDQHYRRSDGGHALYNPFIENYLMDAFATEVAGEVYIQKKGLLGMIALSNGLINGGNQEPLLPGSTTDTYKRNPSIYGKLAYDKQLQEKIRLRAAGSFYYNNSDGRSTLYGGDCTGSNYTYVLEPSTATGTANAFAGRVNPGFSNQISSIQLNLFGKFSGVEVFGTIENAKGGTYTEKLSGFEKRKVNQYALDAIYRIGKDEKFFLGIRFNAVKGQMLAGNPSIQTINRTAIGAGWFATNNILLKGEYVTQKYKDYPTGNIFNGGKFNGIVAEAIVGF